MNRKLQNAELGRLSADAYRAQTKHPIVMVLDNVRSQHNIGAAFRTADAFGIQRIMLCGICATPPNAEMHKAALGAEFTVEWQYFDSTLAAVQQLKNEGYQLLAVEQTTESIALNAFQWQPHQAIALIFGNEVNGVSQEVIDQCNASIEIPQEGTKHSLNVSVSIGVVLWAIVHQPSV
ncbi:tRNA/rRNA methyltransferase [Bacteroidia bacterium]|nr:tRNA/rRNA methyltransferase [Bacteroidia bacterium]